MVSLIVHALIMHVDRPLKLARCVRSLLSSSRLSGVGVKLVILQQGRPSPNALRVLRTVEGGGHIVIFLRRNVGIGPGRELLKRVALMDGCEVALYLDNDIYFNHAALKAGVKALKSGYDLVGFPQLSPSGRLVSPGGYNVVVRGGVIFRSWPIHELRPGRVIEVNGVNAGCMMCDSSSLNVLEFGPYLSGFDDLEKTLHAISSGLKQCVVSVPVIHDRDVRGSYARLRYGKGVLRDSYATFMRRTGLRLRLREHLYFISPPYSYLMDLVRLIVK